MRLREVKERPEGGGILSQAMILAAMLSLCISCGFNTAAEAGTKDESSTKSSMPYQRLDFQVKASCVSCLRRVAKALKATRGVLNADVSIYNPHWAVVIIDTAVIDDKKIIARIVKEKANVDKLTIQDLKEKPIIVVPRSDAPVRL